MRLAPRPEPEVFTREQVELKLAIWSEHLREFEAGTNSTLTRREILANIDRWLDELNTLIGPASARLSAA